VSNVSGQERILVKSLLKTENRDTCECNAPAAHADALININAMSSEQSLLPRREIYDVATKVTTYGRKLACRQGLKFLPRTRIDVVERAFYGRRM